MHINVSIFLYYLFNDLLDYLLGYQDFNIDDEIFVCYYLNADSIDRNVILVAKSFSIYNKTFCNLSDIIMTIIE